MARDYNGQAWRSHFVAVGSCLRNAHLEAACFLSLVGECVTIGATTGVFNNLAVYNHHRRALSYFFGARGIDALSPVDSRRNDAPCATSTREFINQLELVVAHTAAACILERLSHTWQ